MLVKPANFDPNKKYPLFTVIHGGAASMWRDQFVLRWNYHLLAKPGYVVLADRLQGFHRLWRGILALDSVRPIERPGR